MSALCLAHGVRLLAYGTLGGGFLTDRWVDAPEPEEVADWSKMKYHRFIRAIGGWGALQQVLAAARQVAHKHGVSVANVATRWVLEQPAVAAVIVGARLGEREHRADNLQLFAFAFDDEDRALLNTAFAATTRIPGDCGDEYRRPPFLTASGDLSHHLAALPPVWPRQAVPGHPERWRVDSGSVWEPLAGYARAVRSGRRILVSGTTATHGTGRLVGRGDAAAQTVAAELGRVAAEVATAVLEARHSIEANAAALAQLNAALDSVGAAVGAIEAECGIVRQRLAGLRVHGDVAIAARCCRHLHPRARRPKAQRHLALPPR
jgi:hypothetical protein